MLYMAVTLFYFDLVIDNFHWFWNPKCTLSTWLIQLLHNSQKFNDPDLVLLLLIITTIAGMSFLFLYCFFGQLASESYDKMCDCVYDLNWHRLPAHLQKYIVLMIANMQRQLYYHGFVVINLDLNTFVRVRCNWKHVHSFWGKMISILCKKNLEFLHSCPEQRFHVTWHSKNWIKRYKFLTVLNITMYLFANKAFQIQILLSHFVWEVFSCVLPCIYIVSVILSASFLKTSNYVWANHNTTHATLLRNLFTITRIWFRRRVSWNGKVGMNIEHVLKCN